jgi:glycosyltransferase involved in cell wall biosynthesis
VQVGSPLYLDAPAPGDRFQVQFRDASSHDEPYGQAQQAEERAATIRAGSGVTSGFESDGDDSFLSLLGVLQARNDHLQREVEDWQRRFAGQEARIADLNSELELVFRTRSWRITAPLRWVQENLGRSNSVVKLQALMFARRFLPRFLKNLVISILGWTPPAPSTRLHGPALPSADSAVQQVWDRDAPIVSVIIPCFNYGQYVCEAVDSVLAQELQDTEIIVVDDGSTDPMTREVLANLVRPRTRVVRQENKGLSEARNFGIRHARSKYICCLDADDILEPTYLEKAVGSLESNRGVSFAYPWVRLFGDEERVWRTEPFDLHKLLRYNHVAAASVFAKTDWEIAGGFSADLRLGFEDWEFWIRLGDLGKRGLLIPEALVRQRRHGRTMTHEADDQRRQIVAEIRAQHMDLFLGLERVAQVEAGYVNRPVDEPLLNLSRRSQYRQADAPGMLVLLPWLPAGGAEAVMYEVVKGVQEQTTIECTIVTSLPSENEWHDRFYELTPRIYHLPNFLFGNAWEPFLVNLLETRNIRQVLISASELGYGVLPLLKRAVPEIKVYNLLHNDSDLGYFRHSVQYDEQISTHIAVSSLIGAKLRDVGSISPEKVRVIYNGVDAAGRFNPALTHDADLHTRWDVPAGHPVITFCGRLSQEKQPLEFLRIAEALRDETDAFFLMIGDGQQSELVRQAIENYGLENRLRWWRGLPPEQIPELLAVTDILAITSMTEGFPVVMLEALSMGVAVVTYDVGDVRSAISNGVNGWIIAAGDTMAMRSKLTELAGDAALLARIRACARNLVLDRGFTRDAMIENYMRVLGSGAGVGAGVGGLPAESDYRTGGVPGVGVRK